MGAASLGVEVIDFFILPLLLRCFWVSDTISTIPLYLSICAIVGQLFPVLLYLSAASDRK